MRCCHMQLHLGHSCPNVVTVNMCSVHRLHIVPLSTAAFPVAFFFDKLFSAQKNAQFYKLCILLLICFMIYLLTAIELSPGGSSTVHI